MILALLLGELAQTIGGVPQNSVNNSTRIVIAIPILFVHSFLEARAVGILADIESQVLDFLHLVRRPPPSPREKEES